MVCLAWYFFTFSIYFAPGWDLLSSIIFSLLTKTWILTAKIVLHISENHTICNVISSLIYVFIFCCYINMTYIFFYLSHTFLAFNKPRNPKNALMTIRKFKIFVSVYTFGRQKHIRLVKIYENWKHFSSWNWDRISKIWFIRKCREKYFILLKSKC